MSLYSNQFLADEDPQSLRQIVLEQGREIESLKQAVLEFEQLSNVAKAGGELESINLPTLSADEDGTHTDADKVFIKWPLPIALTSDQVSSIYSVYYDGVNTVYVGGDFTEIGGIQSNYVAKYDLTTRDWSRLGAGTELNAPVRAIAGGIGSSIILGGDFTNAAGIATADYIVLYDSDGDSYGNLGGTLNGPVYVISERKTSGTLAGHFVGGNFTNANGFAAADYIVHLFVSSGLVATWTSIGGQLNAAVHTVRIDTNNDDVYVGGAFTNADAISTADYAAKYTISSGLWANVGGGGGLFNGIVRAINSNETDIFYGGSFTNVNGDAEADYVVRFSKTGLDWHGMGRLNSSVYCIKIKNNNIYFSGSFTLVEDDDTIISSHIACTDLNGWYKITNAQAPSYISGPGSTVYTIVVMDNGTILGGGNFEMVGSIRCPGIAAWVSPLSESIDVLASLLELYASRTAIAHDSATITDLTATNATITDATITDLTATTLNGKNIWRKAYKASDESRTADTSLTNDSSLIFNPITSGKKYAIRGRIFFDTAANPDFKFRLGGTATITPLRIFTKHVVPGTTTLVNALETAFPTTTQAVTGAGSTGGYIEIDGQFVVTGTGTIALQWAQNSSSASATLVLAGSWLEILEVN